MNYSEAKKKYELLKNPPDNADAKWNRQRGRDLEVIFKALLENESLKPRIRFKPNGEELDGSFYAFQKYFLIELKWHAKPIAASVLYSFKGKVDGKLIGTIGIFISMRLFQKSPKVRFFK